MCFIKTEMELGKRAKNIVFLTIFTGGNLYGNRDLDYTLSHTDIIYWLAKMIKETS